MIRNILLILMLMILAIPVFSEEIPSDDELFADTAQIVDSSKLKDSQNINEEDKKSTTLTGEITNTSSYSVDRDFLAGKGQFNNNRMNNMVTGNLMLDVRLKKGVKAFANLQAGYLPSSTTSLAIDLKEIFVDANYNKKVYFRMGKQVLTWGRGYFWNPTDMINVEKKSFIKEAGYNSGTYGVKAHIPFGTSLNLYEFINGADTTNVDGFAFATKVEFLLGNTEISVSNWSKKDKRPIFGIDFSSRMFNIDLRGEASVVDGADTLKIRGVNGNYILETLDNEIIPKISLGFSKSFDIGDEKERLGITGEFYYNGAGYEENIFADQMKLGYLRMSGLYEENSINKYYFGFFGTFSKFITNDLTLSCNGIVNLNDKSSRILTGVSYADMNDLSMGFNIINSLGANNTEYIDGGAGLTIQGTAGIKF